MSGAALLLVLIWVLGLLLVWLLHWSVKAKVLVSTIVILVPISVAAVVASASRSSYVPPPPNPPTDTPTVTAPPHPIISSQVTLDVDAAMANVKQHWEQNAAIRYDIVCDRAGVINVDGPMSIQCRYFTSRGSGTFHLIVNANGTYGWSAGVPNQPNPVPNTTTPTPMPYYSSQPQPAPVQVCNPFLSINLSYASAIEVDGVWYAGRAINLHVQVGSHSVVVKSPQYDGEYHLIGYYYHSYTINVPCGGYRWSG